MDSDDAALGRREPQAPCPRCGACAGGAAWCPRCGLNLHVHLSGYDVRCRTIAGLGPEPLQLPEPHAERGDGAPRAL
jgi:hypothetical protein